LDVKKRTRLENNPRQLGAILTLETARIFFSTKNVATNIGRISFRQRTKLKNNPRQLRAMLTFETARIFFSTKNAATNIGHESWYTVNFVGLIVCVPLCTQYSASGIITLTNLFYIYYP